MRIITIIKTTIYFLSIIIMKIEITAFHHCKVDLVRIYKWGGAISAK